MPHINWNYLELPEKIAKQEFHDLDKLQYRRKILTDLLKSEGYGWEQVYPLKVIEYEQNKAS